MRVGCASPLLTASRKLFLPRGIENGRLLQCSHAYQLSVCTNVKTVDAHVCVLPRIAEQCENRNVLTSDRTTELNINFLLTTTVCCLCTALCQ